jgi:hypothetical protein
VGKHDESGGNTIYQFFIWVLNKYKTVVDTFASPLVDVLLVVVVAVVAGVEGESIGVMVMLAREKSGILSSCLLSLPILVAGIPDVIQVVGVVGHTGEREDSAEVANIETLGVMNSGDDVETAASDSSLAVGGGLAGDLAGNKLASPPPAPPLADNPMTMSSSLRLLLNFLSGRALCAAGGSSTFRLKMVASMADELSCDFGGWFFGFT